MTAAKKTFALPFLRRRAEEEILSLAALIIKAEEIAHAVLAGEHAQRKQGSGEKFWQFRDYTPSDRPQDIDWRQSAKGDRLFVRQKEWQTAQTALFWCASHPGMAYRSSPSLPYKHEAAATLSLALAILMTRAGERAGLLDGSIKTGRSDIALQNIGEAFLKPSLSSLPGIADVPRHAGLVLAGDFLDTPERIESAFKPLSGRSENALVMQVLDPSEIDLPFSGRVVFEDPASAMERHHIAHAESVRESYKERIDSHIKSVRDLCHRCRWHWVLHITGTPLRNTLHNAWTMMAAEDRQ